MDLNLKIDVVQKITPQEFDELYFKPQRPVLIKNILVEQPGAQKWTMDWFKQTMGDLIVDLYDSKKTNLSRTAITIPDKRVRFAEYLDMISGNKPSDYRIFLFNIFKHNPALRQDFKCPDFFKSYLKEIGFVFFGGINSVTRMHQDIDMSNVLLTQFDGKKRVVLFDPKLSELLYKLPFNTFSLVDIDKPDYEKFPGLKYVKGYDVILERGDSLFMPSGWWHHVVYLTGGFSVSFRKLSTEFETLLHGGVNLALFMPIDKVFDKLFDAKWFEYKRNIAIRRASQKINAISDLQNKSLA